MMETSERLVASLMTHLFDGTPAKRNALDKEILGEQLACVHRSLTLEDGSAGGP
jgi:hypothetical protein